MAKKTAKGKILSYAEKLDADLSKCPKCGSENLDAGTPDGLRILSMPINCDDCGLHWTEHYQFSSASDFQE